ncbi:MAG: DMT family transporter [Pseudomonadota bacterium]
MSGETLGIALRILSGILFTAMAALVKAIGDGAALGQIVFFRSAVAMLPLVVFLWLRSEFPHGLATRRPFGHLARCVMGGAAMFTSFATVQLLPIAEATMLFYLSPVMIVALAALLLGERPHLRRWGGLVLGVAGAVVLTAPQFGTRSPEFFGIALGLSTAALTAGALVQVRALASSESPGAIAFYFALACSVAGLATMPFGWSQPDAATYLLLIGTGLCGGAAHIAMTLSFRHAEASLLAPFEYLTLLWAMVVGVLFFAETPSAAFAIAAPLVIGGAVLASPQMRLRRLWGARRQRNANRTQQG